MILQALVDYYDRRSADADPARRLPSLGFETKEIPFVVELEPDGSVRQLIDTRQLDGNRLRGRKFLVPSGEKKTSGVKANLLWDSAEYVIGLARERRSSSELTPTRAYRMRIDQLPEVARRDPGIQAVVNALELDDWSVLHRHAAWPEILENNPIMTFALASDAGVLVCQRVEVIRAATSVPVDLVKEVRGWCLVEGRVGPITRLHPSIKGVRGAQTSGANIVSFNARAFESYGKTERQGENAPISERAVFAYTTALNHMLQHNSPNRIQIGDATSLVWADRDSDLPEELVACFGDDPDAHVASVRERLEAVSSGRTGANDASVRFHVLGLSPNAARISVRFWIQARFDDLVPRVLQHFEDLRIVRQYDTDPATPSMFRLLTAISSLGKADHIPPKLAGDWIRSIFEGAPYPATLLNAAVARCRAEQGTDLSAGNVPYVRAAILKACINREYRRRARSSDFQFIKENLDMNQDDPAYLLGRLFAVLERIQARAQPGINTTIRDRYYGSASSTPASVFPTLLRLKNHHLRKLGGGESVFFERLVGEIFGTTESPLLGDFPRQLNLHAQALFAIGYYQQRQFMLTRRNQAAQEPATELED